MGSTTSGSDDHLDAARGSLARILGHVIGSAVSRGDFNLGLDTEVIAQQLETWDEGLQVAVGAHDDGNRGDGLGGTGGSSLGFDIGALGAHGVDDVNEGLNHGLGFVHGRGGDGDVAHFAARLCGALAVEVDAGVGDGEGCLGGLEVGVGGCAADDVEHD